MKYITIKELRNWNKEEYLLIDVRDTVAFQYGYIPHAINIPGVELEERLDELDKHKKIVVYCMKGIISNGAIGLLEDNQFDAYHLEGGYGEYLLESIQEIKEEDTNESIEKSIRKKFHKQLFSKFAKAINEYQLVQEGDRIAICISGGKDSMLMAKLFQELKRHNKFPFELVFLVMDPG